MPELPEVATITKQINRKLPAIIKSVNFSSFFGKMIQQRDYSPKKIINDSLPRAQRHGKNIIFSLNTGYLVNHLGMSGGWRLSREDLAVKHTHLQLLLENNREVFYLSYIDPRRFGKFNFISSRKWEVFKKKWGPDILSKNFSFSWWQELCFKYPRQELKPFLLEQRHLAGIGNYMASEICARAFLSPQKQLGKLTLLEQQKVYQKIIAVTRESVALKGASFGGGYFDAYGKKGQSFYTLWVYQQKRCGYCQRETIVKIIQKGRSTFYCNHCISSLPNFKRNL